MKINEIRDLPDEDIKGAIIKTRGEIFKMNFQAKGAGIENSGLYKTLRRDVARMFTVLKERAESGQTVVAPQGAPQEADSGSE